MPVKTAKQVGFSMNRVDEDTIEIRAIPRNNLSGKKRVAFNKRVSVVGLHVFDKKQLDRLQKIEEKIHRERKSRNNTIKESIRTLGKLLIK